MKSYEIDMTDAAIDVMIAGGCPPQKIPATVEDHANKHVKDSETTIIGFENNTAIYMFFDEQEQKLKVVTSREYAAIFELN